MDQHTPKPNNHVLISVGTLDGVERQLVAALLKVDLGARINVDSPHGQVRMEGRFRTKDVISVIEVLGIELTSIVEHPLRSILNNVAASRRAA